MLRKEIQAKLLKYGSLKEILRKNGFLIIDFAIQKFLDLMSKRFYRPNNAGYGLSEAFFRPKGIDRWSRYVHVANEIQKMKERELTVLEVGSGGQGISGFLIPSKRRFSFFLLDIRKDVFKDVRKGHRIVGDGCKLPFRDKTFDIVISVDTAEHIPRSIRHNFYQELKRVCKKRIILTCPMQSSDGMFQGKKYDILFQHFYRKEKGIEEPNTAQHITAGHPTIEEIRGALPDSMIYGYKNCDVWLKYMLFSSKPFLGLFCGLLYYLFWKKNDDKPPYWGAIIVWDSPESQQTN